MGLDTDKKSVALLIMGAAEVGGKVLYAVFGDHLPFFKLYAIALSSAIAAIVSVFLTISSSFGHLLALSLGKCVCNINYIMIIIWDYLNDWWQQINQVKSNSVLCEVRMLRAT